MNSVNIIGRLTRDVEVRYSSKGTAIGTSAVAINEYYRDQTGEKKQKSTYVELKFFGRYAEIANQYLNKGDKIGLQGKLDQEQWVDQNGQKRSQIKVIVDKFDMLEGKRSDQSGHNSGNFQVKGDTNYGHDLDEDEIPF